jgi:tRNA G10  N-methylase Trm11
MEYLIRFIQMHETFRKREIEALAELAGVNIEFLSYFKDVSNDLFFDCFAYTFAYHLHTCFALLL